MSFLQQLECWGFSEEVINTLTENDIDFKTLVTMTPQDFDIYNIKMSLGNRIRLFKCAKEYMKSLDVLNDADLNENMVDTENEDVKPKIESIDSSFSIVTDFDEIIDVHQMRNANNENVGMNSNLSRNHDNSAPLYVQPNRPPEANRRVNLNSWKRKAESIQSMRLSPPRKQRMTDAANTSHNAHFYDSSECNKYPFAQAFKLNETNICKEAIGAILRDSLEGEAIIAEYENKGTLDESSRNLLVSLIINRCDVRNIRKPPAFLEVLGSAIVDLLPNENKDIYFISARTIGNVSKNTKGKLTSKWRNIMTRMRQTGILERRNRILQQPKQTTKTAEVEIDESIQDRISWLEKNQDPSEELKTKWDETFDYRFSKNTDLQNVEDIVKQWPALDSDFGPQLVEMDFSKLYPDKKNIIVDNWENFFNDVYTLRKNNVRDETAIAFCKSYDFHSRTKSFELDGLRVLILPYLMPPTSRVKTPVGIKKPFIAECAEGFAIWAPSQEDAISCLENRAQRYKDLQLPYQPCVLLVGPTVTNIEASYVALGQVLWKAASPKFAVDLLFKIFFVFNLKYPFDCEQVWLLVQKLLYNIETVNDKRIGIVSSVIASVQAMK